MRVVSRVQVCAAGTIFHPLSQPRVCKKLSSRSAFQLCEKRGAGRDTGTLLAVLTNWSTEAAQQGSAVLKIPHGSAAQSAGALEQGG